MTSTRRLGKEARELAQESDMSWGSAEPEGDDLYKWSACVTGPEGTPYEGGLFNLQLTFPRNYPFKPPDVKFTTQMFHPSVKKDTGEICSDIIKGDWKPTHNVKYILMLIRQLLQNPASETPLEAEIGQLYLTNKEEFNMKAKEYTQKYAM